MSTIGPWHIPQLQLEIECCGPRCRSALFVSATATKGLKCYRVVRDDEYVSSIRAFQRRFYAEFVDADMAPPEDFFFEGFGDAEGGGAGGGGGGGGGDGGGGGGGMTYERFLQRTLELSAAATLVRHIPNKEVQRGASEPFFNDNLVKGGNAETGQVTEVDW